MGSPNAGGACGLPEAWLDARVVSCVGGGFRGVGMECGLGIGQVGQSGTRGNKWSEGGMKKKQNKEGGQGIGVYVCIGAHLTLPGLLTSVLLSLS